MSTLLDKRAEKVRFAGGEQAKRNVFARLAEQKKRVKEKNEADRKRMREVRDNGVKELDIFRKKEAATQAARDEDTRAAHDDAQPSEEQEPKEDGKLKGYVIGAIKIHTDEETEALQANVDSIRLQLIGKCEELNLFGTAQSDITGLADNLAIAMVALLSPDVKVFKKGKGEA